MTTETRDQYRAHCPICFRQHAVLPFEGKPADGLLMVQHGYQRPEGWHQNVNECHGTNRPHFGTPEGRVVAAQNAAFIRDYAARRRADAETLRTTPPASVIVNGKYDPKTRDYEQVKVGPEDHRYAGKIAALIATAEMEARHADQSASEIEKRVAEWKAQNPVAVKVEVGPTIHAVNAYWLERKGRTVALCSPGYARSTSYKQTSSDRSQVSCKACLKSLAAIDADAVVSQKADALIAEMVAKHGEGVKVQFSDAAEKAIKEIRYNRKEIAKDVRKRATDRLERGVR